MADKRCENGHFIDETWDICPYCPSARSQKGERLVVASPRSSAARSENVAAAPPPPMAEPTRPRAVAPAGDVPVVQRTIAVPKPEAAKAPDNRYAVGWLVGLNGSVRGESFVIRTGRNIIGRSPKSDIVVSDEQASAHHADLVFRPDERRYILMDHNSTNGTFVNETEIAPRKDLATKDIVRIGKQKFLFLALCDDTFGWDDQDHRQ